MVWLIAIGCLALGAVLGGVIAGRMNKSNPARIKELEQQLNDLQQQHTSYRDNVSEHFGTTAELVQQMTESYRDVYQHLAKGAQTLCTEDIAGKMLPAGDDGDRLFRDDSAGNDDGPANDDAATRDETIGTGAGSDTASAYSGSYRTGASVYESSYKGNGSAGSAATAATTERDDEPADHGEQTGSGAYQGDGDAYRSAAGAYRTDSGIAKTDGDVYGTGTGSDSDSGEAAEESTASATTATSTNGADREDSKQTEPPKDYDTQRDPNRTGALSEEFGLEKKNREEATKE